MRYSRIALLTFGAGFALGLFVVVVEFGPLARVASGLMALGLLGIPAGIAMDGWLAAKTASRPAKKRAKTLTRRKASASANRTSRPRKPAVSKR